MDPILTIPQVADYLGVSLSKVYKLVQKKKITHLKLGRNVRIKQSDLLLWMEKQEVSA